MTDPSLDFLLSVLNENDDEDVLDIENMHHFQQKGNTMIMEFINTNILEKPTISITSSELLSESQELSENMKTTLDKVCSETKKKLQNSSNKLQNLLSSLYEDNLTLDLLKKLINIEDMLSECTQFQMKGSFSEMNNHLDRIENFLKEDKFLEKLAIIPPILSQKKFLQSKFTFDFSELLESVCSYELSTNSVVLKMNNFDGQSLMRLLQMSDNNEEINHLFCAFANKLSQEVLYPIILYSCSLIINNNDLKIAYKNNTHDNYEVILKHLKECFQFLEKHFNECNILNKLGEITSDNFCELLIQECLNKTIPIRSKDFQNFQYILEEVDKLNVFLESIEYLPKNNHTLLDFIKNINQLFSDKSSAFLLTQGRELITAQFNDLIEVTTPPLSDEILEKINDTSQILLEPTIHIKENIFRVTNIKISKSVQQLVEFIKEILTEGKTSNLCARKNFLLTQDLIELYLIIGDHHHKKVLDTIPQQSAIFYNNSHYLAIHLFSICYEYQQILEYGTWSLGDLILKVKEKGDDVLIKYLRKEQNHILNYLRNSGLTVLGGEAHWEPNVNKAVLQCLRMMKLLHSVWKDILPINIFEKSIGILFSTLIDELIYRIKAVEDMPAEISIHLVQVLNLIKDGSSDIFLNPESISTHAKNWKKFCLLIEILSATLREIENKWQEKDSALPKHFKPEEMKQLIRALFQNTERRAQVLARIQ